MKPKKVTSKWPFGKRITFDTDAAIGLFQRDDANRKAVMKEVRRKGLMLTVTTVNDRENKKRGLGVKVGVPETFLLDESELDVGKLAETGDADLLKSILKVISNGSFPGLKDRPILAAELKDGELHQLRDAMIVAAAIRERQDVLVVVEKTLVNARESLEEHGIKIMTLDEFKSALQVDSSSI